MCSIWRSTDTPYLIFLHGTDGPLVDLLAQDVQPDARHVLVVLAPQLVSVDTHACMRPSQEVVGVAYSGSITPCHSMSLSFSRYISPSISKLRVLRFPCTNKSMAMAAKRCTSAFESMTSCNNTNRYNQKTNTKPHDTTKALFKDTLVMSQGWLYHTF